MIIDYDHNPSASNEQKLQSLMESTQMALNEIRTEHYTKDEVDRIVSRIQNTLDAILQSITS